MGLTERHWFENEDVPENYEWDLEDAVYNSRTNKKHDDDIIRCKDCKYWYNGCCYSRVSNRINFTVEVPDDWFCADGERM